MPHKITVTSGGEQRYVAIIEGDPQARPWPRLHPKNPVRPVKVIPAGFQRTKAIGKK